MAMWIFIFFFFPYEKSGTLNVKKFLKDSCTFSLPTEGAHSFTANKMFLGWEILQNVTNTNKEVERTGRTLT